jgi:hypothetical protein
MTEETAAAKASRSPMGKMPAELKTYLTHEAAEDLKAKFRELDLGVAEGLRDLVWQFLYGRTFSELELQEMAHVVERRRKAVGGIGLSTADGQPRAAIPLHVVGEVAAK